MNDKLKGATESSVSELNNLVMKPCPFCGEQPEIAKHFKYDDFRMMHRCKVMGPISINWSSKQFIHDKWNTRAS